jgi:hypothetical protein
MVPLAFAHPEPYFKLTDASFRVYDNNFKIVFLKISISKLFIKKALSLNLKINS